MDHTGGLHLADTLADDAQADLITAYDDAAGRTALTVDTELGGTTKGPGVYDSLAGTFGITGTLTLDADGDPDAFFIFQMDSTLVTAANSTVSLIDGANPCNVFWQVGSSATINTGSTFVGTVMALTMIEVLANADIEGRLLARNAAVTLIDDTITLAECVAGVPTAAPTASPVGTPGGAVPTQSDTAALAPGPESLSPGTALFTLLVGLAAASLLLLRPRLPVKGRERDR
jgi:type VI secretion system secreted protein VgrG